MDSDFGVLRWQGITLPVVNVVWQLHKQWLAIKVFLGANQRWRIFSRTSRWWPSLKDKPIQMNWNRQLSSGAKKIADMNIYNSLLVMLQATDSWRRLFRTRRPSHGPRKQFSSRWTPLPRPTTTINGPVCKLTELQMRKKKYTKAKTTRASPEARVGWIRGRGRGKGRGKKGKGKGKQKGKSKGKSNDGGKKGGKKGKGIDSQHCRLWLEYGHWSRGCPNRMTNQVINNATPAQQPQAQGQQQQQTQGGTQQRSSASSSYPPSNPTATTIRRIYCIPASMVSGSSVRMVTQNYVKDEKNVVILDSGSNVSLLPLSYGGAVDRPADDAQVELRDWQGQEFKVAGIKTAGVDDEDGSQTELEMTPGLGLGLRFLGFVLGFLVLAFSWLSGLPVPLWTVVSPVVFPCPSFGSLLAMSGRPPAIDLTTATPASDGIEDPTPRVTTSTADSFPASATEPLPAPTTPPHLRHASAQPPAAAEHEEACPICLTAITDSGTGATSTFRWPHCQHAFHTGCAAHMVVENPQPPCPTCRHPWNEASSLLFHAQCAHHGVELPPRLEQRNTSNTAMQPPAPPAHLRPHCCPRLLLADPSHPEQTEAWHELQDRHMAWAPVHVQHTGEWQPEWVCLRCNALLRHDHPLLQSLPQQPTCDDHGPRTLHIDLRSGTRRWACNHPHALCPPQPINANPTHHGAARPTHDAHHWAHRRPPEQHSHSQPTYSWFYVPLLLAATNRLDPATAEAWQQTHTAGPSWRRIVEHLRAAPPIPWQQLHHTLLTLQQLTGHPLPDAERLLPQRLYEAGSQQPSGTLVHLPWAVNLFQAHNGYIPATAQEALLQAFLGEALASATATLAQQWRALTSPSTTTTVATHEPPAPPADNQQVTAPPADDRHHPPSTHTTARDHADSPRSSSSNNSSNSRSSSRSSSDTTNGVSTGTSPGEAQPPQQGSQPHHPPPLEAQPQSSLVANDHTNMLQGSRLRNAFASLDPHIAEEFLAQHCQTFRSPPSFLRGPMRRAMHFSLNQILQTPTSDAVQQERAWKLWMFLPRMLLHKPPGTSKIPKPALLARFTAFFRGQWHDLIHNSLTSRQRPQPSDTTPPQPREPSTDQRAQRAVQLTRLGELSRARQALLADPPAPGTMNTLQQLTDPTARPQQPYQPIPHNILTWEPDTPLQLPAALLATNLRRGDRPWPQWPYSGHCQGHTGRPRNIRCTPRSVPTSGPRQHPRNSCEGPQPGQISGPSKTVRWGPRTCSGRLPETVGCPNHRTAIRPSLRLSMPPISVRIVHPGWFRSIGPQLAARNGGGPHTHHFILWRHRSIRPCQPERNAPCPAQRQCGEPSLTFCKDVLQHPIHLHLGRPTGRGTCNQPSRRGRAGRPPHARLVFLSLTPGLAPLPRRPSAGWESGSLPWRHLHNSTACTNPRTVRHLGPAPRGTHRHPPPCRQNTNLECRRGRTTSCPTTRRHHTSLAGKPNPPSSPTRLAGPRPPARPPGVRPGRAFQDQRKTQNILRSTAYPPGSTNKLAVVVILCLTPGLLCITWSPPWPDTRLRSNPRPSSPHLPHTVAPTPKPIGRRPSQNSSTGFEPGRAWPPQRPEPHSSSVLGIMAGYCAHPSTQGTPSLWLVVTAAPHWWTWPTHHPVSAACHDFPKQLRAPSA